MASSSAARVAAVLAEAASTPESTIAPDIAAVPGEAEADAETAEAVAVRDGDAAVALALTATLAAAELVAALVAAAEEVAPELSVEVALAEAAGGGDVAAGPPLAEEADVCDTVGEGESVPVLVALLAAAVVAVGVGGGRAGERDRPSREGLVGEQ